MLYQKTCTTKKIQEIKVSSDTNGLRGFKRLGGDEGDLTLEVSRTSELPLKDMILLTILPLST